MVSIATKATRPPIISTPLRVLATPMRIAARSGRRRCLIPWIEQHDLVASFDRNGTLRNAEKLLRQGKLEAAAAEYLRVVEDQPGDWSTANTLGDLYARAGQTERSVEQFLKVAEALREEGQYVKAAAIYKKLLKLQPDNERALMQAAELVAGQGLYADARAYLNTVLERRKAAGDARGAAMARVRLGALDPADYTSRIEGAKARVEIGDKSGAVSELSTVASELSEKARYDEAVEALRLAAAICSRPGSTSPSRRPPVIPGS